MTNECNEWNEWNLKTTHTHTPQSSQFINSYAHYPVHTKKKIHFILMAYTLVFSFKLQQLKLIMHKFIFYYK